MTRRKAFDDVDLRCNETRRMAEDIDFSSLLPYADNEIPAVMQRVTSDPMFPQLVNRINPEVSLESLTSLMRGITTVDEFQRHVMMPQVQYVVRTTMSRFTVRGLETLRRDQPYLFVANHRDIVLDAALLTVQLLRHGFCPPELSFGDNLLFNDMIRDFTRLNRMFPVVRGGTGRDFYRTSLTLSHYIRYVQREAKHSVWIAQRSGRTKDGDDRTEPGLLKMLSMAGRGYFVEDMETLHIVPVAISYEYEPCAMSKMHELRMKERDASYRKHKGEDMFSMIEGVSQPKGEVTLVFCPPITHEELVLCAESAVKVDGVQAKNAPYQALAQLIDRRIHSHYAIYPINKLAFDILSGKASADICYAAKNLYHDDLLLQLYANPVFNLQSESNQ